MKLLTSATQSTASSQRRMRVVVSGRATLITVVGEVGRGSVIAAVAVMVRVVRGGAQRGPERLTQSVAARVAEALVGQGDGLPVREVIRHSPAVAESLPLGVESLVEHRLPFAQLSPHGHEVLPHPILQSGAIPPARAELKLTLVDRSGRADPHRIHEGRILLAKVDLQNKSPISVLPDLFLSIKTPAKCNSFFFILYLQVERNEEV